MCYCSKMDVSLLVEVHQYYIKSLKEKIRDNEKRETKPTIVVSAPAITQPVDNIIPAFVPAKLVTIEISQSSCLHGCVEIYDVSGTNIVNTAREPVCSAVMRDSNALRKIQFEFPNQTNVQRIVVARPPCTNMVNSRVRITDTTGTCTYESTPVTESQSLCRTYTYTVPNTVPIVQ